MREIWRDSAWVALLAFIAASLVTTIIWENGDIELKWWAVKAWANFQFPDFPPNHHNMRWGITFPAVIWVRLFGDSSLSYLLLNHAVFALTTAGLYALLRHLTTPVVAAVVLGFWMINPVSYWLPANLMPEVYSMIYPVAALLLVRNAYATGSRWSFAWAVVMMFFAYGAKETNIFFMPGWGLYELVRRRWMNVALIIGVFGGCVLIETVSVNLLLSDLHLWLGRAEAILKAGHLREMSTVWPYEPIDLITRWGFVAETNLDRLEFPSKVVYLVFFGVTAWKAWTWIKARSALPPEGEIGPRGIPGGEVVSIAWAMGLSFAFCTTFFILSFDPLVLGQPLNDRYLWPLLIQALVVLALVLKAGIERAEAAKGWWTSILNGASVAVQGRWRHVSLVAIAALGALAHWPVELGVIEIRRRGYDEPYVTWTAQNYFNQAREHVLQGCTLAFPRRRPAYALLTQSFHFDEIQPTLQFYREDVGDTVINGRRLHGWNVPISDYPLLQDRLHTDAPNMYAFEPFAIRLEGGDCDSTYYYGHADVHPRDQLIDGRLSEPPAG